MLHTASVCGPSIKIEKLEHVTELQEYVLPARHVVLGMMTNNVPKAVGLYLRIKGQTVNETIAVAVLSNGGWQGGGAGYRAFDVDTVLEFQTNTEDWTDVDPEVQLFLLELA
jgi:flavorubredoxin